MLWLNIIIKRATMTKVQRLTIEHTLINGQQKIEHGQLYEQCSFD